MPDHSITLWKHNNYGNRNYPMELQAESTRSSIRIILQSPEEYYTRTSRAVLFSITGQNLWQHFGVVNSNHGFLASRIRSGHVTDVGYIDFLSEEQAGETLEVSDNNPKLFQFCRKVYEEAKERWGYCEGCFLLGHHDEDAHETCSGCDTEAVAGSRRVFNVIMSSTIDAVLTRFHLCNNCGANPERALNLLRCITCSRWMHEDLAEDLATGSYNRTLRTACPSCFAAAETCTRCEAQVAEGNLSREGMCVDCLRVERQEGTVRGWNHKPVFIFHPGRTQVEGVFYVGLEVEVSFGNNTDYDGRANWVARLPRELLYCKSDSSVRNGWEVVTHPMMPEWGLKFFPFEIFDELTTYGARDTHGSTGTHAHINKSAFSSGHLWKLMQIHYRLPEFCQAAGGRASTAFASFTDSAYLSQKKDIIYLLKNKKDAMHSYGRNVALNFSNKETIELRYMAGGTTQKLVRKNLEWVKALLDYSKEITINQINKGVLDDAGYFLGWIYDHKDELPNLNDWLVRKLPAVLTMPEGNN